VIATLRTGQLISDVPEIEVSENTVELGHVNVGDTGVASDQQHVLVVLKQRIRGEISGARTHERIIRQRIDQQKFGMHKEHEPIVLRSKVLFFEEPSIKFEILNASASCDLSVSDLIDLS